MIGDSNFRCINERGVMASVTAVTGGKIGHISNQLNFEDLSNIENVVLSAGQNCINDVEEVEKEIWEKRTQGEMAELETTVTKLITAGKKVFLFSVPPVPVTTSSNERKEARQYINTNLASLAERINKKKKKGSTTFLTENDGNFNPTTDYADDKHLTPIAMERRISQLDQYLSTDQKLKNTSLGEHPTCQPYRGCYGTYPVGCMFCTRLKHNEITCEAKNGKESEAKKRHLSNGSQAQGGKGKHAKNYN